MGRIGQLVPKGAGTFVRDIASVTVVGAVPQLATGLGKVLLAGGATYICPKYIAESGDGKLITKAVGYLMIADGVLEMAFGPPGIVAP